MCVNAIFEATTNEYTQLLCYDLHLYKRNKTCYRRYTTSHAACQQYAGRRLWRAARAFWHAVLRVDPRGRGAAQEGGAARAEHEAESRLLR